MSELSILGAGAFGTALAIALSRHGNAVTLWARDSEAVWAMRRDRLNVRRLPGAPFPAELVVTADLAAATARQTILLAVPMQSLAGLLEEVVPPTGSALVACCKGVDLTSGLGPTGVIAAACPDAVPAVLTGPSFADDIAHLLPTALTLAAADAAVGARLQRELSTSTLRLYLSRDMVGAELGGALKNVVALAAGIAMGAGFGESARAAIITRGFAEMQRFAATTAADPDTLRGLSGLGDLTLTATSDKSRNYTAGLALGHGGGVPQGQTVEGVATAAAVARLAAERGVAMPLTAMVAAVTRGEVSVHEAAMALLARPLKEE
ncbi:NAD(P)H-dependent glycerol-3-phosphate dehydrogenase [Acuticoccus mangrovi]|uniref:Glycerol-3-phosphate dehydrogenase [NAD(P)+] n=1 Tax=Acuticoccus mangrovi TaxID=2796142 RepID=A0A934MJK1_9HYPH|nr:NAD(P)H-dependent glycerol-3-phosphate dehydrogenase [Acuticoccus mangrovi]MBJ3778391.1 NAD(P)-dependent glycerol-3-phosphate dehydrogenase [Acuticoccus mangrovi]